MIIKKMILDYYTWQTIYLKFYEIEKLAISVVKVIMQDNIRTTTLNKVNFTILGFKAPTSTFSLSNTTANSLILLYILNSILNNI